MRILVGLMLASSTALLPACSGGNIDVGDHTGKAATNQGGPYKTPITPGTVDCGPGTPACESPTIQCCYSGGAAGVCAPISGICTDQWELDCDGPEDCPSGMVCSGDPTKDPSTRCAPSPALYQICHDHTQCPATAPNCCPVDMNETQGPQLGECDTRTTLTTGGCDTP